MVSEVEQFSQQDMQALQAYMEENIQQSEMLAGQLGLIEQRKFEALSSIQALEVLDSDDDSVLLPLGGGVSVRARITDSENMLVNVGADVLIVKNREDAIAYLKDRITEMDAVAGRISESLSQIQARIEEINRRFRAGAGPQANPGQQ